MGVNYFLKINPEEITKLQELLNDVPNWDLEMFNIWENAKDELKITIRLGRD